MAVVRGRALLAWQASRRVVRTTFIDAVAPTHFQVEDLNGPDGTIVGDPVVAANAAGHALVAWVEGDVVAAVTWSTGD